MNGNESPAAGRDTGRAREMTRYKVDVGEEFPLSEEEREERCEWQGQGHWEWHHGGHGRHGFRASKLVMFFAAIAVGVALIATAASYPLATLAVAAALFLFAREHYFHHRHHHGNWHGPLHRSRRDAA